MNETAHWPAYFGLLREQMGIVQAVAVCSVLDLLTCCCFLRLLTGGGGGGIMSSISRQPLELAMRSLSNLTALLLPIRSSDAACDNRCRECWECEREAAVMISCSVGPTLMKCGRSSSSGCCSRNVLELPLVPGSLLFLLCTSRTPSQRQKQQNHSTRN